MMLSSVEFVGVFVVIGLLLVHSLWCERKRSAQQEVLFVFDGACIYEVWEGVLILHDELFGDIVEQRGDVYIMRVSQDNLWLAHHYVQQGKLTPVVKK